MTSSDAPALEITDFTYHYKSHWTGKKTLAIDDLSLTVQQGESFGFLGHSGAGKTTTIKAILGLTTPSSGTIKLFGKPNTDPQVREHVGYLPEQPYFYDHLTVIELVEMYAHLAGVPSNEVSAAALRALERTRVSSRKKSPLRSLSKGLTQRVAMAQAIVNDPKLLILDEPFSGLDPIGRKEFKDLLFELKEQGTTIFASSHILEDIEFVCDRASIMAHGELKLVLSLEDLEQHVERSYQLTLECDDDVVGKHETLLSLASSHEEKGSSFSLSFESRDNAEQALSYALEKQLTVAQYSAIHGNLEELFVKLVQFQEEGA